MEYILHLTKNYFINEHDFMIMNISDEGIKDYEHRCHSLPRHYVVLGKFKYGTTVNAGLLLSRMYGAYSRIL